MSRGILVTARTVSSRLQEKCLLPFPQVPVISHVLERAQHVGCEVILCTTNDHSDDKLASWATAKGWPVVRGHPTNKIQRWSDAAERFDISYAHVLDGDDPFFDSEEIAESLNWLEERSLDLVRRSRRSDAGMASVGDSFSRNFLRVLSRRTLELRSVDLDVVPWKKLLSLQDKVKQMPDRDLGLLKEPVRLTLDYDEDYQMLLAIATALGPSASRFAVERFLKDNTKLAQINGFRSEDFRSRQAAQLEAFGIEAP